MHMCNRKEFESWSFLILAGHSTHWAKPRVDQYPQFFHYWLHFEPKTPCSTRIDMDGRTSHQIKDNLATGIEIWTRDLPIMLTERSTCWVTRSTDDSWLI